MMNPWQRGRMQVLPDPSANCVRLTSTVHSEWLLSAHSGFSVRHHGLTFAPCPYPMAKQPFPDAHEYLNAADRLAHGQGYTTTVRDNLYSPHIDQAVNPPRFPPGTSLVLAPFALIGTFPGNVEFGSRLIVVGLVVATGWAAFSMAGWYTALLAALLVSISEFAARSSHVVMSDALAALLIVVCVPLIKRRTSGSAYLWV